MVVEYHRLFCAGKFHHLNYLEEQNNHGKMVEVDHDPEVLLLDHEMQLVVDFVKVVTELKAVRLNFECVQGDQVHSFENPLDLLQLLPQPTLDESSVSNLLQKVAFVSVLHPKDAFVQRFVFPCTQNFSGNPRMEVIVVVAAEVVAEDVVVLYCNNLLTKHVTHVVVAAHCQVSCFDNEF